MLVALQTLVKPESFQMIAFKEGIADLLFGRKYSLNINQTHVCWLVDAKQRLQELSPFIFELQGAIYADEPANVCREMVKPERLERLVNALVPLMGNDVAFRPKPL